MIIDYQQLKTDAAYRHKFYHCKEWIALREYALAQHPMCKECLKKYILEPAIDCDHRIDIVKRPDLCLDPNNIDCLCKSCHAKKTFNRVAKDNKKEWKPYKQNKYVFK